MNNLNDPPGWNIQPDQRGDGGGNKWNYALLVPMLGLAAFRWIWTRESQREIGEAKERHDEALKSAAANLEMKYKDALGESRRSAALLEVELEKERHRVQGYRRALVSQSQQLLEERGRLRREREGLEAERRRLARAGAAGVQYRAALEREREWQGRAALLLEELEAALVERQDAYCSVLLPRDRRLEVEKNLLVKAATDPIAAELQLEAGLRDIFRHDRHCADWLNTDKRRNGRLMWLYLKYWELQVQLQKFKKVEDSLLGSQSNLE
ncbi:coiled-coil domain-containing protein 127a [Lepisosteus oculatus]|uniref:coiled-coil domain-containing protein 127a n=1 Tax=Lepisosteus oculatus TaxID=7918 RepID=UPI0035F50DC6